MLQTNIDLFQDLDPSYLPLHLCMMDLVDQIDKSAKARVNHMTVLGHTRFRVAMIGMS
jgi:hypothetical protein